nr:LysR family transcriptional regulator [uncultured Mediterraneibacter sp.]
MELRVLKYFLTVANEGNITRAAGLLHITQPTLSRQMIQLEEELGVKLLKRKGHHIYLTEDGVLLKRRAREITLLAEKTQKELSHRESGIAGEISIGSGEFRSSRCLTELLAQFQAEHPLVRYEIYSGNTENIKERIERGILDLGLLMEPEDISKYDFVRLPQKEKWGILVKEDSPLAEKESIRPEDLADIPLIMTRRESVKNELLHWFGKYAGRIEIMAGGNLLYNMASMARSGIGTVVTPVLECAYEGLKYVPLTPELKSGTVLVWKKDQPFSSAAQALIDFIRITCREEKHF